MMTVGTTSKKGQALIELLLGLVGIMVLMMGIELIASIVYNDFITIYSAREEVAEWLVDASAGTSGGSSTYDWDSVEELFTDALNPSGELYDWMDTYPGDRDNQFDFVSDGESPLEDLVGSERSSSTYITSELLQKVLGRSSVSVDNAVYMPPWKDLL